MLSDLELLSQIKYHDVLYWEKFAPIITDEEYDALVSEADRRGLLTEERVKSFASAMGKKVEHKVPMLSLEKCHSKEDVEYRLKSWTMPNPENIITYRIMPKVDGVSASVRYDQSGKLEYIATRGRDGLIGECITRHAAGMLNVPVRVPAGPLTVRGEIVWLASEFERFKDSYNYSNARNAVAGMVLSKDPDTLKGLGVIFIPFDVVEDNNTNTDIHHLLSMGFSTIVDYKDLTTPEEVWPMVLHIQNSRHLFRYKLDGVVISIPQKWARNMLGCTVSRPKWATAYKFSEKEYKNTTIKSVSWQTGRTGIVTPVVNIEPVTLYETEVQNVSAHNVRYFNLLKLREDSVISVTKGGEIIPYISSVVSEGVGKPLEPPVKCPECLSDLVVKGVNLVCTSDNCVQKIVGSILHWCSKQAVDIDGVGEVLARNLVVHAGCRSPLFLYTLNQDILSMLPRMGVATQTYLMDNITASTKAPLHKVLCGLGIPGFGAVSCKAICNTPVPAHLSVLVAKQTRDSYISFSALNNNIKQAWCNYWDAFTPEYHTGLFTFLEQAGFNLMTSEEETLTIDNKLSGLGVFVTGGFPVSRSILQRTLATYGCELLSSATKASYFLVGDDATAKKRQIVAKAAKVNDLTMSPLVYIGDEGFNKFITDFGVEIR